MPSAGQIGDAEVNAEINQFYREVLPSLVYLDELRGYYVFSPASEEVYDIPDTIINVFPPCFIDDVIAGFYYDPTLFFTKHAGEAAGSPTDVLLLGRTLYLGPPADTGPHVVSIVAINKPTKLVSDTDTIVADRLKDTIELGASMAILSKQGDDQAIAAQNQYMVQYLTALKALGAQVDVQSLKDERFRPAPGPAIQAGPVA
jgi:hypothetical protein